MRHRASIEAEVPVPALELKLLLVIAQLFIEQPVHDNVPGVEPPPTPPAKFIPEKYKPERKAALELDVILLLTIEQLFTEQAVQLEEPPVVPLTGAARLIPIQYAIVALKLAPGLLTNATIVLPV